MANLVVDLPAQRECPKCRRVVPTCTDGSLEDHAPTNAPALHMIRCPGAHWCAVRIQVDTLGDQVFEAADHELWCGFICPAFTRRQADKIVQVARGQGARAWYDAKADRYYFHFPGAVPDSWGCRRSDGLYPIGAQTWTWLAADEPC